MWLHDIMRLLHERLCVRLIEFVIDLQCIKEVGKFFYQRVLKTL